MRNSATFTACRGNGCNTSALCRCRRSQSLRRLNSPLDGKILHSSADKVLHGGFIHAVYDWDIPAAFIALVGAKTGGDVGEI